MSRTMSAVAIIIFIGLSFFGASQVAHAEKISIPLGDSIFGIATNSNVEAHLDYVEIDDNRSGNTYSTTPLERVKWFRLYYWYENHGDKTATGNLKLAFYDQKDNEYKLDEGTYTGDTVAPGTRSSLTFVELPIPRDSNIVTIRVYQGFESKNFSVPEPGSTTATAMPTVTPTAAPSGTATATGQPTADSGSSSSCLPLLPFALLSIAGIAGIAAGKRRVK